LDSEPQAAALGEVCYRRLVAIGGEVDGCMVLWGAVSCHWFCIDLHHNLHVDRAHAFHHRDPQVVLDEVLGQGDITPAAL
jgi:hypothetical protein